MTGPRLGAHLSIAGGITRAIDRAEATGCESLQIFTKNSNQWRGRPLDEKDIAEFKERIAALNLPVVSHASYLINLAAPDKTLREKSIAALEDELARGDQLGLEGVVLHPGAYTTSTETDGIQRIAEGIAGAQSRQSGSTLLLLEHTAGQGTMLGHRFEQLRAMIDYLDDASKVAFCLDTCHLVAAGYDIISETGYEQVFTEFDEILGLNRLAVFHLNDSKKPLGSRVDRHDGIGQGHLGTEPFRRLVQDSRFTHLPMMLETPKKGGGKPSDVTADPLDIGNLSILRGFRDES
jgi:deoxyribonuclease-4